MRSKRGAMVGAASACLLLICASLAGAVEAESKSIIDAGTTVHVIFSSHLDIGYTDLDNAVIDRYFHELLPRALRIADEMRSVGRAAGRKGAASADRYIYMAQPWILSMYLDCPKGMGFTCPDPGDVAKLEAGIRRGDITWNGFPFNAQLELFEPSLLTAAMEITRSLDRRFGVPPTATVSQRDVPGATAAAIPLLCSQGIRALSVGINSVSAPPGVPHNTPFYWRDPATGESLLAFFHPGGYSGRHWDIDTDDSSDCVQAPGFNHVLCTAFRCDNCGPPIDVSEVQAIFSHLRQQFPGANVVASTFDSYVNHLTNQLPSLNLPTVKAEIGDTWIYGVASDPLKVSNYKAAARARAACLAISACKEDDAHLRNFSRLLMKVPEHTWGLDTKCALNNDYVNLTNAQFHPNLAAGVYQRAVDAWSRQARYVDWALEALPAGHPVAVAYGDDVRHRRQLAGVETGELQASAVKVDIIAGQPLRFRNRAWSFQVDPITGALGSLRRRHAGAGHAGSEAAGVEWAGAGSAMAQLVYSTYDEAAFDWAFNEYAYKGPAFDPGYAIDLGCFNCSLAKPVRADTPGTLIAAYVQGGSTLSSELSERAAALAAALSGVAPSAAQETVWQGDELKVYLKYEFSKALVEKAGAPAAAWLVVSSDVRSDALRIAAVWQNKTVTRQKEATWLRFKAAGPVVAADSWRMSKLQAWYSPLDVMLNGSKTLHVVGDGGVAVGSARCWSRAYSEAPSYQAAAGRSRGVKARQDRPQVVRLPEPAGRGSKGVCSGDERLFIRSLDAPLACFGRPSPFPVLSQPPDLSEGVSFNLHNNAWGTNYPIWVPLGEEDVYMAFRFELEAMRLETPL